MNPTIALFLHHPRGSVQCGNGIIKSLQKYYNFKIFTRHELETDFFNDVDCVAFPGGVGDADSYDWLLQVNGVAIQQFVHRGGKYLGICMGAYWADQIYFDILQDLRVVQYIKRPGTDTRRPHPKACAVNWRGQLEKMYFYDGCAIVGSGACDVIATYANGDAMAVIQNNIGIVGCHPESQDFWYDKSYLRSHWHHGRHNDLLLEFVDQLMCK